MKDFALRYRYFPVLALCLVSSLALVGCGSGEAEVIQTEEVFQEDPAVEQAKEKAKQESMKEPL